jgi:hypothetical protein
MTFGSALLLGLALSAPASAAAPGRAPPAPAPCTKYRVQAEKNELAAEGDVAAWATAALEKAALFDARSPCYVHVRITAGPIRSGGRQDGWVAHVALSTRRYLREGKLVTREKGMLLVEAEREPLVARAREFLQGWIAKLAGEPADRPESGDEG